MHGLFLSICLVAFAGLATATHAQSPTPITKKSAHDVAATVARLEAAITKRGASIVAKVDHAAAAKANGMQLAPTVLVIFGNPKLGTPLMQSAPTAGMDLPMRVLVWQDTAGTAQVGYWPPAALAQAHGIKDREQVIQTMTGALDAITNEAVAR